MNTLGDVKDKVNKLSECLNGKEEIDVAQVLNFFDQIIEEPQWVDQFALNLSKNKQEIAYLKNVNISYKSFYIFCKFYNFYFQH